MSKQNLFWELLELSDSVLVVDNDCCYISYDFNKDEDYFEESESFDYGPEELAFMFGEKLGYTMENC